MSSRLARARRTLWAVVWTSLCSVGLVASGSAQPLLGLFPVAAEDSTRASRAADASERLDAALRGPGGFRVVGLDEAGGSAGATAKSVRGLALETGADAVVVGRLEGGKLWLELRSGHSGGLLGGWTLPEAVETGSLVPVMLAMREAMGAPPPPELAASAAAAAATQQEKPLLGNLRGEGPISIQSDQLDVVSHGGKRHLLFTDNVRVEQGDIQLLTHRLDAYYNEGESQPERLEAKGDVHVVQGDRVAECESATYLRAEQRVVCSGRARLVQGCDVVRGKRIEFDLEREHFTVMGAASVVLGEKGRDCSGEVSS